MQVQVWGDGLGIHLPSNVVKALNLQEGDEVEIEVAGDRILSITRSLAKEDALAQLRALSRPLPPDFRFSRDEANERTE